jgi:hypothetical protein
MTMLDLTTRKPQQRDLVREQVAPFGMWYGQRKQALPPFIDDLTAELGDDVYERMLRDPVVSAALNVLTSSVLAESVTIIPAIDDRDADGYQQSADLVPWCQAIIDNLDMAIDDVLFDLLNALALGNRVAEQVYHIDQSYSGKQEIVLRALKVKPRASTAFVVDEYLNVIGLLGYIDGKQTIVNRDRFAVMSFRPKDYDPRGQSILRSAYNGYELKMRMWPEYLKYLVQFASPSLFATVPEGAGDEPDGNGGFVSAVDAMLSRLLAFQNGSAMAAPFGSTLKEITSQGEGKAFLEAFRLFDKQMMLGIIGQTRSILESEFGSRADSQTANDVLQTLVRQIKRSTARMLRRDVLRMLVRYNYGPEYEVLTPYVTLGETEPQDWAARLGAAASAGYLLDPSQWPGIDELLNLPPRAPAEDQGEEELPEPETEEDANAPL